MDVRSITRKNTIDYLVSWTFEGWIGTPITVIVCTRDVIQLLPLLLLKLLLILITVRFSFVNEFHR